ncbi:bacteriophage protein gp37 [alpha proteobacterium U9-1i]|nr:bacteriophage protein gp37 [alpha proteobacterium U9-1i]
MRWNVEAENSRQRPRVFCASMADVFEDRRDLDVHRERLWLLIDSTPHLDWLLLTKRPQNVAALAPWGTRWPENVWLGATIENQKVADERMDDLAAIPARVRFVSAEPLLSALDLRHWLGPKVHWVITGGESGGKARPPNPTWFRSLRDQCQERGAAFHFKQWGEWVPASASANGGRVQSRIVTDGAIMLRLGKKAAGRELDGRTWDELPTTKRTKPSRSSTTSPKAGEPSRRSSASKLLSGPKAKRA